MLTLLFTLELPVRLFHTDAVGVLFHGQLFSLTHTLFEEFLSKHQLPLGHLIAKAPFALPVVHCQGSFHRPISVSDILEGSLSLHSFTEHSFTLSYLFTCRGAAAASAEVVHVSIDKERKHKIPLPPMVKELFHIPT